MDIENEEDLRGLKVFGLETLPASQQANVSRNVGVPKGTEACDAFYRQMILKATGAAGEATYEWILQYRDRWRFFLSLTHARRMSPKAASRRWERFVEEAGLSEYGFVHVQGKQASGNPDHHALIAGEPDIRKIQKAWKGTYGGSIYLEPIRNIEGAACYLVTRNRYYLPIVEMTM